MIRRMHASCTPNAREHQNQSVSPPQVVLDGQVVHAPLLDRAVVDVHPGVVADGGGRVYERAERQVELTGTEDRAVENSTVCPS